MSESVKLQIDQQAILLPGGKQADRQSTTQTVTRPRRRYIKVDVSEEVFIHVHDMANKSRMRLLP